jgi:hypothetical protein
MGSSRLQIFWRAYIRPDRRICAYTFSSAWRTYSIHHAPCLPFVCSFTQSWSTCSSKRPLQTECLIIYTQKYKILPSSTWFVGSRFPQYSIRVEQDSSLAANGGHSPEWKYNNDIGEPIDTFLRSTAKNRVRNISCRGIIWAPSAEVRSQCSFSSLLNLTTPLSRTRGRSPSRVILLYCRSEEDIVFFVSVHALGCFFCDGIHKTKFLKFEGLTVSPTFFSLD